MSREEGDGKRRRTKSGALTEADRELWQRLAHSVEPLRRVKGRVLENELSGMDQILREPPALAGYRASEPHHRPLPIPPVSQPAGQLAKEPPPLAPFDRKRSRRIASGRIEIEARLDLHGARQLEAHGRFHAFIMACAARGLSTVLVVTGKGHPSDKDEPQPFGTDAPQRGVLRRSVPMWLESSELRALVASYTTADIRHGGAGALYIHLRRRMR